ncbi:MAG: uracil-DNA glycosylase [Candidatus Paceibacterota bacterium]
MSKKELLENLNKEMLACSKCALRAGCSRVVPGEGSAEAEIMFIGEGPGKKEDELGRPFVGAAGKFLDEMLTSIKLKREDIYIANIVKCRPPENRDPLPEEIEACWPWLLEQIKIIEPKLIVFLGRHSMNRFFPNEKISETHGKLLIKNFGLNPNGSPKRQHFLALYHPASALYNGGMRETLLKDFKKIPMALEVAKGK